MLIIKNMFMPWILLSHKSGLRTTALFCSMDISICLWVGQLYIWLYRGKNNVSFHPTLHTQPLSWRLGVYHSSHPPGCLPHVCWLYDNKNCCFVSFPTLYPLNCPPKQWTCFKTGEGGRVGGLSTLGYKILGVGGISREKVAALKNFKYILQTLCSY